MISFAVLAITIAALAIPVFGQFVTDVIVGVWRRLPNWLRWAFGFLIGLAILAGLLLSIPTLVSVAGFAFHEPWAVWAGVMTFVLYVIPFIWWDRTRMTARTIAAYLAFFAFVCLGTMITNVSGRTITLIATFLLFVWMSSHFTPLRRRVMIGFGIILIAVSLGWSFSSYIPTPITSAVRSLGSVSALFVADIIEPENARLQQIEREGKRNLLENGTRLYEAKINSVVSSSRTQFPTGVQYAQIQDTKAEVERMNQAFGPSTASITLPGWVWDAVELAIVLALVTGGIWLICWLGHLAYGYWQRMRLAQGGGHGSH
ncbi:hypothetical protein A3D09_03835 [Candidatus Collierbacteria bacterium RIFCSPHIGHO2_02_FULL_49_10]|uniref:Uncharacterized protein n=1 Tax=Candidatus Collierbacteria bacterium RIFCSPHIGHO2_02_FULL_49_10 TaxID=1817723 RepID=A0A1F5ER08_9BACT|nr:MAG: hypothetical protein A3D09_03835 [Candidatus Collierbacteria bacterium RIFCSPHIGHO2_02_FULL_49_10]